LACYGNKWAGPKSSASGEVSDIAEVGQPTIALGIRHMSL
jgi:hypothetical protein